MLGMLGEGHRKWIVFTGAGMANGFFTQTVPLGFVFSKLPNSPNSFGEFGIATKGVSVESLTNSFSACSK